MQVYGIVGAQLMMTTLVSAVMMMNPPVGAFMKSAPALHIGIMLSSFGALFALHAYKDKHPTNLAILGIWTFLLSLTVGTACTVYAPSIVLQGLALTSGVVIGLTVYTFWAVRKGLVGALHCCPCLSLCCPHLRSALKRGIPFLAAGAPSAVLQQGIAKGEIKASVC